MSIKNFEFKARVDEIDTLEKKLLTLGPQYIGQDHQKDTYFNVPFGRLKLREGTIENCLINYDREDKPGSKESRVILYEHPRSENLKKILAHQLGVKVVVEKKRKIYFIGNVKFHFDVVANLGTFIEVEAIDRSGEVSTDRLKIQCESYFDFFQLAPRQLIDKSYSDLILEQQNPKQGTHE